MAHSTVPGALILTMPLPDSKSAPEKFKGKYSKIRAFIIHYELLLEQNNVAEKDKCDLVTRYCSRKVTEFIQALSSYSNKDWPGLKADLLKYYDADLDNKKYRIKDLIKLVKSWKEKKMKSLSVWRNYGREFITIGGWLKKKGKITDDEYATYYWNGIPKTLRNKLENRLLAADPTRSLASPFKVDEINRAAEALLQRDRFDAYMAGSDDEDDSEDEDDSDEDSSDSDEDDLKTLRRRMKKKAKYSKKKASDSDSDSDDDAPRKKKGKAEKRKLKGKEEPEIESLIKELNSMSINDPGYAALVFRAIKLDPEVLRVIRPPAFAAKSASSMMPMPPPPKFPPADRSFHPAMTPNYQQSGPTPIGMGDLYCFGCGSRGHRMLRCPDLQQLMATNIITKGPDGRFTYADGTFIQRMNGETLVAAVKREKF